MIPAATYSRKIVRSLNQEQFSNVFTRRKKDEYRLGNITTEIIQNTSSESREIAVSITSWTQAGSNYDCDEWAPNANTVISGTTFTQARNCKKNETRNRIYTVTGQGQIQSLPETRSDIPIAETQLAVGTKVLAEPECANYSINGNSYIYNVKYSQYSWTAPTYNLVLRWNNQIVGTFSPEYYMVSVNAPFVADGYVYTHGRAVENYTSPNGLSVIDRYVICRTPVN